MMSMVALHDGGGGCLLGLLGLPLPAKQSKLFSSESLFDESGAIKVSFRFHFYLFSRDGKVKNETLKTKMSSRPRRRPTRTEPRQKRTRSERTFPFPRASRRGESVARSRQRRRSRQSLDVLSASFRVFYLSDERCATPEKPTRTFSTASTSNISSSNNVGMPRALQRSLVFRPFRRRGFPSKARA